MAASAAFLLALGIAAPANADTAMTAGTLMEKLPTRERSTYIMGLVEGLAYARFQKDSAKLGSKDSEGMNCIYGFFYGDSMKALDRIEAAFKKYSDHFPAVVLTAIVKKECGE
ncbi:hypothetical protein KYK29_15630 [Shinella daejeonensis]|uniref:hypothetical protein n=1 Tax=Shinella daejeonensis TaxID=659017 RepID=UPI0020C755CD|nr:hypothetical protein [Shinella daejeonensis]MCP8896358.1 hypothetical protein [Shinella daejeonensis]